MTGYPERQRPHVPVKREADASYTTDEKAPGTIYLATYRIQRSHFEMWVSLPGELQHALHNYTRLKDNETDMMDEHLDQVVDNWVHEFPQLHRIKYELTTFNRCDIVLFNAHFHLMNDFPPRHSKLGIGLELDFQCDEWPEMQWTREKKNWSCTTHIYQDGHLLMAPMHEECYGSEEGNVKPLFQSRWWASVLTSLTEAKKLAEETKDLAAMELADTRSRNFFKGLTIMQEIFALRCKRDERVHKNQKATRAAILLWRFSQAPSSSEAVTTWQHVTLRSGSDSPAPNVSIPPPAGMDLPALPMNPLIDYGTSIGSFEDNSQLPLQQQDFSFDMFPASMDEELCQDGFMTMTSAQMAGLDQLQSSFHFPGPRRLMTDSPLDHQQETFVTARDDSQRPLPVSMQAVNFFELPQLLGQETSLSNMTYVEDRGLNGAQHETAQEHDQPLARFNVQAHQALQEHLGADGSGNSTAGHTSPILKREQDISQSNEVGEHEWHQMNEEDLSVLQFLTDEQRRHESVNDQPWTREDQDDETLRAALLAASGANSDHDQQRQARPQTHDGLDHGQAYARAHAYAERQHQPLRVLPLAVRPVLQSHHSFPGLRSQDSPSHVLPSNSNSNRFEQGFGNNHNLACHNESMLQSHFAGQTMDHISASFRMDDLYAPVAVSEGSRGLPRAQSEPDPYLGALSQLVPPLPVLGSQHDDNETISSTQTRSQSQGTDGLTLDGSFVEVSMDDVHDEMTLL